MPGDKQLKKTRGTKKVRKATKKQRRRKTSKSGKPKGKQGEPPPFHFLRTTGRFSTASASARPNNSLAPYSAEL
jgi:hypothetical protein